MLDQILNPDWILSHGGLYIVLFIVFAETGLLIGFLLPGDPLLFITGIIIASMSSHVPNIYPHLMVWIVFISAAAILGNFLGYWLGHKWGAKLMQAKDRWYFKKKYLLEAKNFYDNKGGSAIVFARFVPVVRTFAPMIAGMVQMNRKRFALYNILGGFLWVATLVGAGFLLGENTWVKTHLEWITILIVLFATAPVLIKSLKTKMSKTAKVPSR